MTDEAMTKLAASLTPQKREALAGEGKGLKKKGGGASYPIPDVEHLKAAIQAFGRSKPEDRKRLKNLIKKRARELGHPELIPDSWKTDSVSASAPQGPRRRSEGGSVSAVENLRQKADPAQGGDALARLELAKGRLDWSPRSNWV